MAESVRPLNLFISYAHEDERLCKQLLTHLSQLKRDGVEGWYDRRLKGGDAWAGRIDEHLNTADIILLLISSDFLASKYCYDVEMKRALELHDQKQARVIPLILRPCEWQKSPFGRLNALPTDGTPIVDWATPDHGFLNVAEGLRRVVEELRAETLVQHDSPRGVAPAFRNFPERHRRRRVAGAGAALLVLMLGWFWWSKQQRYIAEGEAFLNVGRFNESREPFQEALKWNPWSSRASHGLEAVKLYDLLPKPVEFLQRLKELSKDEPQDAYLKILEGNLHLGQDRRDEALADYRRAAELNPDVAEAYYGMCVVYDMLPNPRKALEMCQKAVDHAELSPHYRANLAAQYFRQGDYPRAVQEYRLAVNETYPLAKLELAKVLRLQGEMEEAREKEQVAIEELESDSAMASFPENSLPWSFQLNPTQAVWILSRNQKRCYAYLTLSATLFLMGAESKSRENSGLAAKACGAETKDIREVVEWELTRLADEQTGELVSRANTYRGGLRTWGNAE